MKPTRLLLVWLAAASLQAGPAPAEEEPSPPPADPAATPPPPSLVLRGFGNVDFEAAGGGGGNQFVLGELDVFLTSQLSEDLSVLAEVAFEPQQRSHDVLVDVERYQVKWAPSDLLSVAVGRMHAWVGYWNHNYHHGAWFQVTACRPLVYRFEDDGGVLALHEVGIQAMGTWVRPSLALDYNVSLTNGRGPTSLDVQSIYDANRSKAVNLWAAVQPAAVPGLQLGGSLRFDEIPEDREGPGLHGEMSERVQTAFAVYARRGVELVAEIVRLDHVDDDTGRRFVTRGLYAQGSIRVGRVRPYYRYDDLDTDEDDPFLSLSEPAEKRHTVGLRVDPWPWAALKIEAAHHDPTPGAGFGSATLQLAFTF